MCWRDILNIFNVGWWDNKKCHIIPQCKTVHKDLTSKVSKVSSPTDTMNKNGIRKDLLNKISKYFVCIFSYN